MHAMMAENAEMKSSPLISSTKVRMATVMKYRKMKPSTAPAMDEALEALAEAHIHLDAMRLRAFPFPPSVLEFIEAHDHVFVVEQNRDAQMRSLLINGARAVVSCEHPAPWITGLLTRRPFNVVVIAVAHKLARTAWAIVAHERDYDSGFKPLPPTCAVCSAT